MLSNYDSFVFKKEKPKYTWHNHTFINS
jgi:hypothetical protein